MKEQDAREFQECVREYLDILYSGEDRVLAENILNQIYEKWLARKKETKTPLSEKDCIMIAYGDCIQSGKEAPLHTLDRFLREICPDTITNVHLLPVFPYTSDDGFSVKDYKMIDPAMGSWDDIKILGDRIGVMMDAVINHTSRAHEWFQKCRQGEFPYTKYYIECDKNEDYSKVTRPRALPLLTEIETCNGKKWYWTTFSDDQIDVNFHSPYLLAEIIEVLLLYAANGARFIRLDAIGFAWKRLGTTCMNLKETHTLVKLLRRFVEEICPGTYIITETNVPHLENISYFGNGDEAHLVYQFPLPPLVFHTMLSKNAEKLTEWAKSLDKTPLPEGVTYFNFLASHDGIGMRPVDGLLDEKEKQQLLEAVTVRGGRISYKKNMDGSTSPYELNINYLSAVTSPDGQNVSQKAACFLASQAIMLSMQGVPGIYYHSLLGSENWTEGVEQSGINRRINREKFDYEQLKKELRVPGSLRRLILEGYLHMLKVRSQQRAFSPYARQKILDYCPEVFALERENVQKILVLINITDKTVQLPQYVKVSGKDLLNNGSPVSSHILSPYQVLWLEQF